VEKINSLSLDCNTDCVVMPTTRSHRRGTEEKNRKGKLAAKASSFHGRSTESVEPKLHRPRTVPNLLSGRSVAGFSTETRPRLTKLLLNVTVQRSLGPVMVLMPPELTVEDLIEAALQQYKKEGRRPVLPSVDPSGFDLHYSQFSLESLEREDKLVALGSRNFFLCPKKSTSESDGGDVTTATSSSCSKQADKATKTGLPWLRFMEFLL